MRCKSLDLNLINTICSNMYSDLSSQVQKQLKRIWFKISHKKIPVIFKQNINEIDIAGIKLGPYQKGSEVNIEWWISQHLISEGIVEPKVSTLQFLSDLEKGNFKEINNSRLQEVSKDLYYATNIYRQIIIEKSRKNPEPMIMHQYEKIASLLFDISLKRSAKLLKIAHAGEPTREQMNRMTDEEKTIVKLLSTVISSWKEFLEEQ